MNNSKKRRSTGSIPRNLHQGSRSEYLAQYFFTAFGTSVPVPHQEDSGIDLQCTLGDISGTLLYVNNYYFVQVKSTTESIYYETQDSCNWLLSHNYPFIVCLVIKKENIIELYQTTQLSRLFPNIGISNIELRFSPKENDDFLCDLSSSKKVIFLDKPILKSNINELSEQQNVIKYRNILKYWIELDQKNILRRQIGLCAVAFPKEIKTNEFEYKYKDIESKGNFKIHLSSPHKNMYYENLFYLLSNEISIAASTKSKERFEAIADLASFVLENLQLSDSIGLRMMQIAINKGAENVNSTRHLRLNIDGKSISTDNVKIIG